jgi:HEAT repeat protein
MKFPFLRAILWIILFCPSLSLLGQAPKERAWQMLRAGVSDKSADTRARSVRSFGLLKGDAEAIRITRKALGDENPDVRVAAATASEDMHCIPCIPDLRKAIQDKDESVVLAAAHALHALGDAAGYEVYYAVLTGQRKTGNGLLADQEAMLKDPKKMAKFGFEQGIGFVPFGGIGWGIISTIAKDDASPVRASAAAVLANDPDPLSGQALVKAVSDKSWVVRAAALEAIARRGDARLLDSIVPALSDDHEVVRMNAAAAVIHLSR